MSIIRRILKLLKLDRRIREKIYIKCMDLIDQHVTLPHVAYMFQFEPPQFIVVYELNSSRVTEDLVTVIYTEGWNEEAIKFWFSNHTITNMSLAQWLKFCKQS